MNNRKDDLMLRKVNGEKGFSLIELMIVIVVIGILAGVAIPQISQVRARARISNVKSEFASIKPVMEMYYMDHGQYPENLSKLDAAYTSSAVIKDASDEYYDAESSTASSGDGELIDPSGNDNWQTYEIKYNQDGTVISLDSRDGVVRDQ